MNKIALSENSLNVRFSKSPKLYNARTWCTLGPCITPFWFCKKLVFPNSELWSKYLADGWVGIEGFSISYPTKNIINRSRHQDLYILTWGVLQRNFFGISHLPYLPDKFWFCCWKYPRQINDHRKENQQYTLLTFHEIY